VIKTKLTIKRRGSVREEEIIYILSKASYLKAEQISLSRTGWSSKTDWSGGTD
jgi:hypothetical protein